MNLEMQTLFMDMAHKRDAGRTVPAVTAAKECHSQAFVSSLLNSGALAPAFSCTLPIPPSLNNMFANAGGRGRVKSADYKAWLAHAGMMLNLSHPPKFAGPYAIHIHLPAKMRGDIGNREKALSDLLVKHGVVADDKFAHEIRIARSADVSAESCVVFVTPVEATGRAMARLPVAPQRGGEKAA